MSIVRLAELTLNNKRVLIRLDLNVPIKDGAISSDKRIVAALTTIKLALKKGAKVMLMSHLGRPEEGVYDQTLSLAPVAVRLSELLAQKVPLVTDWLAGVEVDGGQAVLCENVRFNRGERANNTALSQKMAKLCDVFVMDAFGTAHRAEASTCGIIDYAPIVCAGELLSAELVALKTAMKKPKHPIVAIVGGAKVSTKLTVLASFSQWVDTLIVGGGIANTFIAAQGLNVGKSLYEPDLVSTAKDLLQKCDIPVPTDVVVAKSLTAEQSARVKQANAVSTDDMIFDIGPESVKTLTQKISTANTIIWNGPIGVFEVDAFAAGTKALAEAIAKTNAFSLAGGGDTLAAIDKYDVADDITYISTGGGAFLEFLEGKTLPAVAALQQRAQNKDP